MKTNSTSRSGFLIPRVVLGFVLCSAGVFLAAAGLSKSITDSPTSDEQKPAIHGAANPADDQSKSDVDWPQYGFDSQHTSFNPAETQLGTSTAPLLQVAWQYFFPCSTYAFDAANGARLWTYTATSYYSPGCFCASPSIVNGRLYVGVTFGYQLYAFDLPEPNPVPLISQPLVPDAVPPGGAGFTLILNGTGLVSGSVVNWNGRARATTFVSNSQLTASILASNIATVSCFSNRGQS